MEFLVRTENRLPPGNPDETREGLRRAERARAQELRDAGVLKRLWRVPGRNATIGLYEADDPAALHDALVSLPMWKWMDVTRRSARDPPAGTVIGSQESVAILSASAARSVGGSTGRKRLMCNPSVVSVTNRATEAGEGTTSPSR